MHKILFHVGKFPVYSYGFMIAIGFVFAIICGIKYGKFRGFKSEQVLKMENTVFISGIIGARILYIIFNLEIYGSDPLRIFNLWSGGLSWYGGVVAGILAMVWFSRKEKIPFLDVADLSVISGILGLTFGRIGCFLNGCCYGKASDLPWAVVFPAHGSFTRHPTQIYEAILDFIIFLILIYLWNRNRFRGEVFASFLCLYSLTRFFVEFFRENTMGFTPFLLNLNIAQVVSLMFALCALLLYKALYDKSFVKEKKP